MYPYGILLQQARKVKGYWKYIGGLFALIIFSIRDYFLFPKGRELIHSVIVSQLYFTGYLAMRIIMTVAFALGAITVIQLFIQLSRVGALDLVGQILNIVIIRELGPLITAIVVIARSGSAISAEIGTMMIHDEVNALEMQGISPLTFLVFPRIIGVTFSVMLLTLCFNAVGLIGGFTVGNLFAGITFATFQAYIINAISFFDMGATLFKSCLFGLFIGTVPIYHGFQAFSPTQIPLVTTKAVVSSISFLFLIDILVTVLFAL